MLTLTGMVCKYSYEWTILKLESNASSFNYCTTTVVVKCNLKQMMGNTTLTVMGIHGQNRKL